jgi:hypothetical protein
MRRFRLLAGLAAGLLLALGVAVGSRLAVSEENPVDTEAMKRWREFATPGEHHKALGRFVGTWDVEFKAIAPGGPTTTTKGTSEYSWLMEGRWLQEHLRGEVMGQPYQGFGVFGWDNFKKKHVATWVDNKGTAMVHAEGAVVDPTGKVQVLYGHQDEFMTGENDKVVKLVTRMDGNDRFTFEVWDMAIGENGAAVLKLEYTRRKP